MKLNLAIFVSGSGSNMEAILEKNSNLELKNFEPKLVVSSKKNNLAIEKAKKYNIEHIYFDFRKNDISLIKILKDKKIDIIALAGFLKILSPEFIDEFENRIINIHPSLIPLFCGKSFYGMRVHEAVKKSGMKITGASCHIVDSGIDTGKILYQKSCDISDEMTIDEIQKKVLKIEHEIFSKCIDEYSGEILERNKNEKNCPN